MDRDEHNNPYCYNPHCTQGRYNLNGSDEDIKTSAEYRERYPNVPDGSICPSCEDEDSKWAIGNGVCYICICGCPKCEGKEENDEAESSTGPE